MAPVLWSFAATTLAILLPALGYRLVRPASRDLPWPERARRLSPLRTCLALGALAFVPGALWFAWQLEGWRLAVACALAAMVGLRLSALVIGRWALAAMEEPLPFERADARRAFLGKLPLHAAWLVPFVAMATRPGPAALALVGVVLVLTVIYVRFQSHWLLWVGHFRGARSDVLARVRAIADDVGATVRGVYQTELGLANAMALPWSREVTVTRGALLVLSEEELDAVLAHELEHLDEATLPRLARLGPVSARVLLAAVAGYGASFGDLPLGLLVVLGAAAVALLVWRMAIGIWARSERDADEAGAGHDGPAYGRALVALYRANLYPIASRTADGHASLRERLEALGVEPDFEPTGPPSQLPALITLTLALVAGVGMVAVAT